MMPSAGVESDSSRVPPEWRGFRRKTPAELRTQVEGANTQLKNGREIVIVPPSLGETIFEMPLSEVKKQFPERFRIYRQLLLGHAAHVPAEATAPAEAAISSADGEAAEPVVVKKAKTHEGRIMDFKRWLVALNGLDTYITRHQEGKEHTLKDKQFTVFEKLRTFLERGGKSGYIKLPTGVGKTVLFSEVVEALDASTAILVPKRLLVAQTEKKLAKFAPELDVGKVYSRAKDAAHKLVIYVYNSFINAVKREQYLATTEAGVPDDERITDKFDFLILDEAHKALGTERRKAIEACPDAVKIGFTATPNYSPDKKLIELLEEEIAAMSVDECVDEEMLAPYRPLKVTPRVADMSKLRFVNGRPNDREVEKAINIQKRNLGALELYKDPLFYGKKMIGFCAGRDHARDMTKLFKDNDINAEYIGSDIPETEQEKILSRLERGVTKVIFNADILKEGFDDPSVSICFNLAPTWSSVDAEQRGGRVLRIDPNDPDKVAFIVDFIDEGLEERGAILFGAVAAGEDFNPRVDREPSEGGGNGSEREPRVRYPKIEIEGMEVINDIEEYGKIVRRFRARAREIQEQRAVAKTRRTEVAVVRARRATVVPSEVAGQPVAETPAATVPEPEGTPPEDFSSWTSDEDLLEILDNPIPGFTVTTEFLTSLSDILIVTSGNTEAGYQVVDGVTRFSSALVDLLYNDIATYSFAPSSGWYRVADLTGLGLTIEQIGKIAAEYGGNVAEHRRKFRVPQSPVVEEYLSDLAVETIMDDLSEEDRLKIPLGWVDIETLSRELDVTRNLIESIAEMYREASGDCVRVCRNESGKLDKCYSEDLVRVIGDQLNDDHRKKIEPILRRANTPPLLRRDAMR